MLQAGASPVCIILPEWTDEYQNGSSCLGAGNGAGWVPVDAGSAGPADKGRRGRTLFYNGLRCAWQTWSAPMTWCGRKTAWQFRPTLCGAWAGHAGGRGGGRGGWGQRPQNL
jgi:hypothetical protein